MEKYKKFLYFFKTVVFTSLFMAALYFENAQQERLLLLYATFAIFLISNMGKYFIKRENMFYFLSFVLDASLIYFMEFNSRLLINYFFHTFYIIVLLEAALTLEKKQGIMLGTLIVLVSMVKYIYLIYFKFNLSNVSQMMFFLMINVFILIIAAFAQHNKQEKERMDILYGELLDAHKKLREYNDELRRLSVVEERNSIARDIHDNLGHNMTALIMQLQMAEHYLNINSPKSQEMLESSIKTAKNSLTGIREVVETLRGKETALSPYKAIKVLSEEFSQKTGAEIDLKVIGEISKDMKTGTAVYHILQEGLTNAVRHGNASKINMELEYSDSFIKFSIKDNGKGAENLEEGFGMKGIRERVDAFNGKVEFQSCDGFKINGILYLEEKSDKVTAG